MGLGVAFPVYTETNGGGTWHGMNEGTRERGNEGTRGKPGKEKTFSWVIVQVETGNANDEEHKQEQRGQQQLGLQRDQCS